MKYLSKISLEIDYCCCGDACCWDKCRYETPPADCLQSIPNSQWIFSEELGYFQAFKGTYLNHLHSLHVIEKKSLKNQFINSLFNR